MPGCPAFSMSIEKCVFYRSSSFRLGRIGTRNRVCAISIRASRLQAEKVARAGRQKIHTAREILCDGTKGRSIVRFQGIQEFVTQHRRRVSSICLGNEKHVQLLYTSS